MKKSTSNSTCFIGSMKFLYITYILYFSAFFQFVFSDDSFTMNSSGNKTVPVFWTVGNTDSDHKLRCIADGTPLPTLSWKRGDDATTFTGADNIVVDTNNPSDISITFTSISYEDIQDYYCVAQNSAGAGPANYTYFKVLVGAPVYKGTIAMWTIILGIFCVGVVAICRTFRLNDIATRIET